MFISCKETNKIGALTFVQMTFVRTRHLAKSDRNNASTCIQIISSGNVNLKSRCKTEVEKVSFGQKSGRVIEC